MTHPAEPSVLHVLKATGVAGAETHLLTLLPALKRLGVRVSLLVLQDPVRPQDRLLQEARSRGVRAQAIAIHAHLDPTLLPRFRAALRAIAADQGGIDILHAHLPHGEVYGARAIKALPGAHFVQTRHNDDPFRRGWLPRLAFAQSLRRSERIIAISEAIRQSLAGLERVPAAKIVTIPYGLDGPRFLATAKPNALRAELGLRSQAPLVGFVGRLVPQKGADTLLGAFASLEREFPGSHLVIAGDGPLRGELEALARRLGLKAVSFLGWRNDIATVLSDIDVLAVPSRWEGFGLVVLEAMAAGRPVVASRVSALPEIVRDGKTGILVAPGAPDQLALALSVVLSEPKRARRMGTAGQARLLEEFTVGRMAMRTRAVYDEIIGRAASQPH